MSFKNSVKTALANLHAHNKTLPDIYIFTLPRAGSTLLAEILNTNAKCKMASESFALNNDNLKILKKYFEPSFLSERYVDITPENMQNVFKYYQNLSHGKHWNAYYWSDLLKSEHSFKTSRTIFKTHKFTYDFDSIMNHFNEDYGIYLLRNPVSHSLSRLSKKWTTYVDLYAQSERIRDILPTEAKKTIEDIKANGSNLETFVASWCLENYVFIRAYQEKRLPSNVFPVFYEQLIINSENTIKDLCLYINMPFDEKMLSLLDVPSSGIVHSTKETKSQILSGNKNYLVNRWREGIDAKTLSSIYNIVNSFGITLYLDELSVQL